MDKLVGGGAAGGREVLADGRGYRRIFYQDGRGSFSAPSHILAWQRALGKAVRKHGTAFWADAEVWREVNVSNRTYAGADTVALQPFAFPSRGMRQ